MKNDDFYVVFALLIITIVINIIIWRKAYYSPIKEPKILGLSLTSFLISVLCILLSILFINNDQISYLSVMLFKLSFLFIQLSSLLIVVSFFLPEAKRSYQSFFIFGLIVAINSISAYINTTELKLELINDSIQNMLSINGLFFLALSGIILVAFIFVRYIQVVTIMKQKNLNPIEEPSTNVFLHSRPFGLIILIIIYVLLTSLEILIASVLDMRNLSWLVLLTLNYLFFTYILIRDFALFFITPVKLEAVLVMDQESGVAIYSKNFLEANDSHNIDIFAGLFTALNLSVKDIIKSKKHIEQLSFGDKVIILASGTWIASLFIVSDHNFSTNAIAKYFTLKFEKMLKREEMPYKPIRTTILDPIVEEIREYLPL